MSIMQVGSSYPPGITGNPYTPWDIGIPFDMNWEGNSGVIATGFTAPGISGLGQDDPLPVTSPDIPVQPVIYSDPTIDPTITSSAAACGSGWSLAINSAGQPICTQNDPITAPLNTPLTPTQAGLTPAQQAALIAATGNSTVSLIRTAAGGPYTVAGTNLVYNPTTGQLTTAAAVNASASLATGLASIEPYIPLILAAVAAMAILPSLLGGKR